MPIRNSRRAVIEAQSYLDRKRQNISKEDLERVKAFAEMYQPRAKAASGSATELRGTKRAGSPLTRGSYSSFATRAYSSSSLSPSPSPSPSSSSFKLVESSTRTAPPSPSPQSASFSSFSTSSPRTPRSRSVFSACAEAIRQWIMALLTFVSLARALWDSTTSWLTFMFTATFGVLCSIKSPAYPARAGSSSGSKSIVYSQRRVSPRQVADEWAEERPHPFQLPSPPPSPPSYHNAQGLPVEIYVTSMASIDEASRSRSIMTSFDYELDACDTVVEEDSWEIQLVQQLAWAGRRSELGVTLNAALNSSLARLSIVNCSMTLDDVIAVLSSCAALQTLEVQEVQAPCFTRTKRLLPRHRYFLSPTVTQHQLKVLCITSAVPCERLFTTIEFCAISRLILFTYGAGCNTAFPSSAMLPMKKTLKTFSLFGEFRDSEIDELRVTFPMVTCNDS